MQITVVFTGSAKYRGLYVNRVDLVNACLSAKMIIRDKLDSRVDLVVTDSYDTNIAKKARIEGWNVCPYSDFIDQLERLKCPVRVMGGRPNPFLDLKEYPVPTPVNIAKPGYGDML